MGSFVSLHSLRVSIREAHPEMTPQQVTAEAERYYTTVVKPVLSEREIIALFENGEYRHEGTPPRRLPRYSNAERIRRREISRHIRKGALFASEYLDDLSNRYVYRLDKGRPDPRPGGDPNLTEAQRQELQADACQFSRGGMQMFYRPTNMHLFYSRHNDKDIAVVDKLFDQEETRRQQVNDEIAFLFDTNEGHWEAYYTEKVAELKNTVRYHGMQDAEIKEDIRNNLRERRTKLLMERMDEVLELAEHLDEMSDPRLTPAELAENLVTLQNINSLIYNIDNEFLIKPQSYAPSPEDREKLEECRKLQSKFTWAEARIAVCASPLYEYLDPEALMDYSTRDMVFGYADIREGNRGHRHYDKLRAKHKNYKAYVSSGVSDCLTCLLQDAVGITTAGRDVDLNDDFEKLVTDFGFTLGENGAKCRCEFFNHEDGSRSTEMVDGNVQALISGRPLVFEQDGRTAVLSLKSPTSADTTWDAPEALFNYSLKAENERLTKELKKADPWYRRCSDAFRNMRTCFENLSTETKLTSDSVHRKLVKMQYTELLALSNAYLANKPDRGHNLLEQRHIDIANKLRTYAAAKLEQLDLVAKARLDLDKFRGLNADQIKNAIANKKKYPVDMQRRMRVMGWLFDQHSSYYAAMNGNVIPDINGAMTSAYSRLRANEIRNPEHRDKSTLVENENVRKNVAIMVGTMLSSELILQERSRLAGRGMKEYGPLERSFREMRLGTDEMFQRLGEAAVRSVTGRELNALDGSEMMDFLSAFDVRTLTTELDEIRQLKLDTAQESLKSVYDKSVSALPGRSAEALADFNTKYITRPLEQFSRDLSDGKMDIPDKEGRSLLVNCVISSMIQLEAMSRSGTNANRLLHLVEDPARLRDLQSILLSTQTFRDMVSPTLNEDGRQMDLSALSALLGQRGPQNFAKEIMADPTFQKRADNVMQKTLNNVNQNKKSFRLGEPK